MKIPRFVGGEFVGFKCMGLSSNEDILQEKMDSIPEKVRQMVKIVSELETDFPGRHFTLDGHLVGSIGEVAAAYYYGIKLYPP